MAEIKVHGLWVGENLSPIELLCMHSYITQGHEFHLWVYEKPLRTIPKGVILEDATQIIPVEEVFFYKNKNQFGHGKGSYAGFSDVFRFQLLYLYGGWWTDMDVICLKPLTIDEPYVFRTHHDYLTVGNIMKCPSLSPLMKDCSQMAKELITRDNTDWNIPIAILNKFIGLHSLQKYVKPLTNPDRWLYVRLFLIFNKRMKSSWYAFHMMNEEWRQNNIDKNALPLKSTVGQALYSYGLYSEVPLGSLIKNVLKILIPRRVGLYFFLVFKRKKKTIY